MSNEENVTVTVPPQHYQVVEKLGEIPLVNDSYNKAAEIYSSTKSKYPLLGSAMTYAESGLKKVSNSTPSVALVNKLDCFACNQLEKLEKSYPVIMKPTEEIISDGKNFYSKTVSSAKTTMYDRPIAAVQKPFNYAADTVESCIDKYLTSDDDKSQAKKKESSDDKDKALGPTLSRISQKTKDRLFRKAMRELGRLEGYSKVCVDKMQQMLELIDKQRTEKVQNLSELKKEYQEIVEMIKEDYKSDENSTKSSEDTKTSETSLNERIMNSARAYAEGLIISTRALSAVSYRHLSEPNQERIQHAVDFSHEIYSHLKEKSLHELSDEAIKSSKEALSYLKTTISSAVDTISSYVQSKKTSNSQSKSVEESSITPPDSDATLESEEELEDRDDEEDNDCDTSSETRVD